MAPLQRRCPRCREIAEFGRAELGGGVQVRVNFVPMGDVHAPAGTLVYSCRACGSSFRLLPKFAYMLLAFGGVSGLAMMLFILQDLRHADDGRSVMLLLGGAVLVGLAVVLLGRDLVLRGRSPAVP